MAWQIFPITDSERPDSEFLNDHYSPTIYRTYSWWVFDFSHASIHNFCSKLIRNILGHWFFSIFKIIFLSWLEYCDLHVFFVYTWFCNIPTTRVPASLPKVLKTFLVPTFPSPDSVLLPLTFCCYFTEHFKFHVQETIIYLFSSIWLTSLSMILYSSIHVLVNHIIF